MKKYKARELLELSPDQLWALPDEKKIKVVFDDGMLTSSTRRTIFSVYMWDFHRRWPQTPLLMEHHIGEAKIGKGTHLDTLGKCMWMTYDTLGVNADLNELTRIAYEITNTLYNDMTYRLEPEVSSVSILDFIDVMDQKDVKEANATVKPYENSITSTYDKIEEALRSAPELNGNPVADAARSGLVSMGQILQCVGPRGYLTDIDSTIFRRPVMVGYVEGIKKLYDLLVESRSAAKATSYSRDYVAEAEYFNRKMQLISATLRRVHGVAEVAEGIALRISHNPENRDCGSKAYRSVRLRPGDLKLMAGKYYLTEENKLQPIMPTDRHLIDKSLKVRSVFDCRTTDREGVCATCFGELALSIPGLTNVGHLCATQLCEMVSQAVLSTKHLDQSSSVDEFPLSDYERRYLRLGADTNHLGLSARLKSKHVKLIVNSDEAPHLSDIQHTDNVEAESLTRISELTGIRLVISGTDEEDVADLPVSVGSRKSSMSHKLLNYIKVHGWQLTENGDYLVDLKDWSQEDTLFELALKHMDMVKFMMSIEKMVKSGGKDRKNRALKDFDDPWGALMELYSLVSSKLSVNLVHLEMISLSFMIISSKEKDYNMPLVEESSEFGGYEEIMSMRSLSARLAYKGQEKELYSPYSYVYKDRPIHPLDAVFAD